MDYKQAIAAFNKRFPELNVLKCVDYDKTHYVVEALEDPEVPNFNSPFYAVNKKNGKITGFIPSFDLDAFFDAIENRTVYSTY